MNITVDHPSLLLTPEFREEMVKQPLLVAHVQEADWIGLQSIHQIELRTYRASRRIVVAPAGNVQFGDLYEIFRKYPGFSMTGLMVIQYCLNHEYPIYSRDRNLLRVARELGIIRYVLAKEKGIVVKHAKNKLLRTKVRP